MTTEQLTTAPGAAEIVSGDVSGGPNTSHTIVVDALAMLLAALPTGAAQAEYEEAALKGNMLGKQTEGARRRTFRYLKELYLLRPNSLLFRACAGLCRLRDLGRRSFSRRHLAHRVVDAGVEQRRRLVLVARHQMPIPVECRCDVRVSEIRDSNPRPSGYEKPRCSRAGSISLL